MAVDQEGRVLISSNPAAGASSWSSPVPVSSSGGILAVPCPTVALCVLVTGVGNVITSEDPTGGPAAWSEPASVAGGVALTAVSCSSQGLCAALDHRGEVVASVNPTGGTSAWSLPAGGSGSGRWLGCNIVCFRYCVSGRRPWWWCNNRYLRNSAGLPVHPRPQCCAVRRGEPPAGACVGSPSGLRVVSRRAQPGPSLISGSA